MESRLICFLSIFKLIIGCYSTCTYLSSVVLLLLVQLAFDHCAVLLAALHFRSSTNIFCRNNCRHNFKAANLCEQFSIMCGTNQQSKVFYIIIQMTMNAITFLSVFIVYKNYVKKQQHIRCEKMHKKIQQQTSNIIRKLLDKLRCS